MILSNSNGCSTKTKSLTLDFKQNQYPFERADEADKSELLKDILAFANTTREDTAYILIGVKEVKGKRNQVVGINQSLDDAQIQQFVNSKTQKPVVFSYQYISIGKSHNWGNRDTCPDPSNISREEFRQVGCGQSLLKAREFDRCRFAR